METYDGTLWAEPNPVPDDRALPLELPSVDRPADVDTIPLAPSDAPTPAARAAARSE
jgi:lysine 2,3-aminomutase